MLDRAREVLETAVNDNKAFPGAQAAVLDNGRLLTLAVGTLTGQQDAPIVNDATLYDLASVTKPISTAACVAVLMQQKKIGLDDQLAAWVPEARDSAYASCTIEQLLCHTSGLPDWLPLYKSASNDLLGSRNAIEAIQKTLLTAKPIAKPLQKEVYSDLDFFLLGQIVEKAFGKPLKKASEQLVFKPIDMNDTSFRPVGIKASENIAPTGICPWRKKMLVGEVHDDNTWACGGIAGQAGLFGTASDLMTFAAEIIDGLDGDGILFDDELLDLFCTRPFPEIDGTFTLGWDTVSPVGTLTGNHFGPRTIGHHGFTGTSLWIDPEAKVAMALLTNRVFYGDDKTKINRVRPLFFDAVWEDIGKR